MKVLEYVKDSFTEFKENVTWSTWPEAQRDTMIVAVATIILAIFLYLVDTFFGDVVIKNLFRILRG